MKIEDDLKLHSHYIENLFKNKDEVFDEISEIKGAISEMRENAGIHASTHSIQNQTIMKSLDEINKNEKNFNEMITALNNKTYSKFYAYEIIKDVLSSPKNWVLLMCLILVSDLTIGFATVLKHFLRLV